MRKIDFKSGAEMLNFLASDHDLYNLETEQYIFSYNEDNAIAVYYLSNLEAKRIAEEAGETEYWGSILRAGGNVYNDPSDDNFNPDWLISNLDYCNSCYDRGIWVIADNTYPDPVVKEYNNGY